MSRDSSATYLHMHSSRLADLFEDFCRPPSNAPVNSTSGNANVSSGTANANNVGNTGDPSTTQLPGHFLPFEEIHLPPHLMPVNPEDEDDVVPDMHAAFGIQRALGQDGQDAGAQREPVWRDLGLERLVEGGPGSREAAAGILPAPATKKEGKRPGRLALMR